MYDDIYLSPVIDCRLSPDGWIFASFLWLKIRRLFSDTVSAQSSFFSCTFLHSSVVLGLNCVSDDQVQYSQELTISLHIITVRNETLRRLWGRNTFICLNSKKIAAKLKRVFWHIWLLCWATSSCGNRCTRGNISLSEEVKVHILHNNWSGLWCITLEIKWPWFRYEYRRFTQGMFLEFPSGETVFRSRKRFFLF